MEKKELKQILILLISSSFLMLLMHIFRFLNSPVLPMYDQYNHIAQITQSNFHNPLNFIFSFFTNYIFLIRLVPFLSNLISILLLYLISKKIIKDYEQRFFSLLIIILSPIYLYTHTSLNMLYLPLLFILLGIYGLLNHKYFLSGFSFIISLIFNPQLFIVIILILITIFERNKKITQILPILGILLITYIYTFVNNFIPHSYSSLDFLTGYISDFGALVGFGIFGLLAGITGILFSLNKKNYLFYFCLISLFISSLYYKEIVLFIEIVIAFYAGILLKILIKRKWASPVFKNYVIILILCGLIFSSGSHLKKNSEIGPEYAEIRSLEWLKNIGSDKLVISHHEYGFMIKAISGLDAYTDNNYYLFSKEKTKINKTQEIYLSRDLQKIILFFNKNNIKYIWINQKMKQGQVWKKEDQGILLLLENSRHFKKIYNFDHIEIWEII